MGNCTSATPPTIRMTIESTDAKIGRSIKKCEITKTPPRRRLLRRCDRLRRRTNGIDGIVQARHLNALRDDPIVRRDAGLRIRTLANDAAAVVEQLSELDVT